MVNFFKKLLGLSKETKPAKFSVGQPVCYEIKKNGRVINTESMKVVDIQRNKNHTITSLCSHQRSGAIVGFTEDQLVGRKAA